MTNFQKILGINNPKSEFNAIEWKVQNSKDKDILFYKIPNDLPESLKIFEERIKQSQFGLCIVNKVIENLPKNVIGLNQLEYDLLKEDLLNEFYPITNNEICFLGVTGTNGKTTVVETIRQICVLKNLNILTFGTLGVFFNNSKLDDLGLTTPDYIDLRKIIFNNQEKLDVIAMELSSIALVQNRTGSLKFDGIGWTNFTQDHLDFHKTMDEYFKAKALVFTKLTAKGSVIIPDTQKKLIEKLNLKKLKIAKIEEEFENTFFKIAYNKENLSVAMELLAEVTQVEIKDIEQLKAPPGRANIIEYKDSIIVIDYAHTPDGILSISEALKKSFPSKKLTVLFGCGGDRDRKKRKLMAKAAAKYSDFVFLTSDNPRFEDPVQIINDAKMGLIDSYKIIVDRKEAIKEAVSSLNNCVLLIAGKGHENYIDIMGTKYQYNDSDWVKEIICD